MFFIQLILNNTQCFPKTLEVCITDGYQYWLVQILDEMTYDNKTAHESLTSLQRYAKKCSFDNVSFLKVAFLEACERINLFKVGGIS